MTTQDYWGVLRIVIPGNGQFQIKKVLLPLFHVLTELLFPADTM